MYKTIAGQRIELSLKFNEDIMLFNIDNIDSYDELEIDEFYGMFVKAYSNDKYKSFTIYEFIKDVLSTKEELIRFAELGSKVVNELKDVRIIDKVIYFYEVINLVQQYRAELKKK